jgi:hypothetical protein
MPMSHPAVGSGAMIKFAFIAVITVAVPLASCGSTPSTPTPAVTAKQSSTPAVPTVAQAQAEAVKASATEKAGSERAATRAFKAEYPKDVDLQMECHKPHGTWLCKVNGREPPEQVPAPAQASTTEAATREAEARTRETAMREEARRTNKRVEEVENRVQRAKHVECAIGGPC